MIIGTFRRDVDSYTGRIQTLSIDAEINIRRAPLSEVENAPAWRVFLGDAAAGVEIGAGWVRSGSRGIYLALQIDDPLLTAPLRANLFDSRKAHDEHVLLWSRADAPGKD
ncbi:DUF736 domain-containing protein [Sphingopyxis sp.]|uniref:DUF736 domain-containing protein n=1 Tax=Sphingopyxis sp. TaxID=1908224 RepID=UPI003D6C9702